MRSPVSRLRTSPRLAPDPPALEARFSILGCAASPLSLAHIIAEAPLRRQGRSWRSHWALPRRENRHTQGCDGQSVSVIPSPASPSGSRRVARWAPAPLYRRSPRPTPSLTEARRASRGRRSQKARPVSDTLWRSAALDTVPSSTVAGEGSALPPARTIPRKRQA